jgi:hypothetical protein
MYVCMYVSKYVLHVCMHVRMYVRIQYIYIYICIYVSTYYIYVCICIENLKAKKYVPMQQRNKNVFLRSRQYNVEWDGDLIMIVEQNVIFGVITVVTTKNVIFFGCEVIHYCRTLSTFREKSPYTLKF